MSKLNASIPRRNVHLQVMITQDQQDKLAARATRDGLSVPEVVRAILAAHLRPIDHTSHE